MALSRILVLRLATDVVFLRDEFPGVAHVEVVVDVPEAVRDHSIDHLTMPKPLPGTGLWQVVRHVAHRLHATCQQALGIARTNRAGGLHDGLEAAAADLVDRGCPDRVRDARGAEHLPRRILAQSGLQHDAHQHLVDRIRCDTGALQRSDRRDSAELRRAHRRETTLEFADRGSAGRDQNRLTHGRSRSPGGRQSSAVTH